MPRYEYACESCDNQIEVVQSFSDEPLTECDVCGGHLRRVFHPVGVLFKGSGFYSTDNKSKRSQSGARDSKDSKDSSQSSESSKNAKKSKGTDSTSAESKTKKSESAKPSEKSA